MSEYTEFRIVGTHNNSRYEVHVKGWFWWRNGYLATDFFDIYYSHKDQAIDAVANYKNRITLVVEDD